LSRRFWRASGCGPMCKAVHGYVGTAAPGFLGMLGQVWSGAVSRSSIIVYVLLLTPLVAFYFLRDWDSMVAKLGHLVVPAQARGGVRGLAREIR